MHILTLVLVMMVCSVSALFGFVMSKRFPRSKTPLLITGFVFIAISAIANYRLELLDIDYFRWLTNEFVLAGSAVVLGVIAVHYRSTWSQRILHDLLVAILGFYVLYGPFDYALRGDQLKNLGSEVEDGVTIQTTRSKD